MPVGWFSKGRSKKQVERESREVDAALLSHLNDFVATRPGVEIWVEGPTSLNPPSVLLIANDGEWTRRSVPSVAFGHSFAIEHALPSYDAGVVGYPQRMRDYNARNRPKKQGPRLA